MITIPKHRHIPLPNWIKWDKDKGKYVLIGLEK
jgi:hypothetical protein